MKFGLRRKRDCSVFSLLGHSVINPLNSLSRSTSTYPTAAMKRTPSARAPSPTNTTYSGISNYRTDQYKPLREKSRNPSQAMDPKAIARIHHEEMAAYLENHLAKGTRASLSVLSIFAESYRTCKCSSFCSGEADTAHAPTIPRVIY